MTVQMYCTAVCPYCVRAEKLLNRKGVKEIEKIRVDLQPELRDRDDRKDRAAHRSADIHQRGTCGRLRRSGRT